MSQNGPLINASPSSASSLETSSGISKSFSNTAGTLKTTVGDMIVSLENVIEPLDTEIYNSIFLESISQDTSANFLFDSHNIVFISPELAELEIQIGELLSELFQLDPQDKLSTSDAESTKLNSYESYSLKTPLQLLSSLPSFRDSDKKPILSNKTPNPVKATTASSLERNDPSQKISDSERALSPLKKEESSYINIEANLLINKEEKIVLPPKQEKEHQHKQQEHKHQEEKEKEKEKQHKQQGKGKGISSKVREIDVNSISIEQLKYYDSLKKFKKVDDVSPCLKKKFESPIKVFNAAYSNNKVPQKINQKVRVENIFVKFMQLMAKILGQAEAEAHELYLKIKERTDTVDLLTLLLSKVNSEKEEINWEDNEEMKLLVNKARQCGVDIPSNKYNWTEEEKKLLKENIQMRKDSLEKITQLERTDMQRYLQEVSQCHQTRSNVLKLLKEVIDTFIYNLRP